MPISTINASKELAASYQPLLLAEFVFTGGATLRLSTHPLSVAQGGAPYGGNDYLMRIDKQDLSAIQAMSEQGIDIISDVRLHLLDADAYLWTNFEKPYGFRHATLTMRLVQVDIATWTFSSTSMLPFVGRCDGPSEITDTSMSIRAVTKRNLAKIYLPEMRIQKRCPHIFPGTATERAEAAADILGVKWKCAYSPDQGGGVGNLNGGSPFTECDYTKAACVARGMYTVDSSARTTGTFGGLQYDPPGSWRGKGYVEGKDLQGENNKNLAKYNSYVPLVYGTQWVPGVVTVQRGDPNYTHAEVVAASGYVGQTGILRVVVNGVEIPKATAGSKIIWWNWVNDGNRKGSPNQQAPFSGDGDPYGSMATIVATTTKQLVASDSSPAVMVLVRGAQVRVYSDVSNYTYSYSENPAWIILDMLLRAGWKDTELDIQSFIDEAAYCATTISHTNLHGSSVSMARFLTSLAITAKTAVADVLTSVRLASRAILVKDASARPKLVIEKTLADQQPGTISGSNDTSGYASVNSAGAGATGYVAYHFDEDSILKYRIYQAPTSETPNSLSFSFQDSENQYSDDLLTLVDATDITMSGSKTESSLDQRGIMTYDQGKRVGKTHLYRALRGNELATTKGTYYVELETTIKGAHLYAGQIVSISSAKRGWTKQLFRIIKLAGGHNMETVKVTCRWHSDTWYTNTFGQVADPTFSRPRRDREARPPFAWQPHKSQALGSDPIHGSNTWWSFGVAQVYPSSANGSPLPYVRVSGELAVNDPGAVAPPAVPIQGNVANSGGSITGPGQVFLGICSVDSDGIPSFMAPLVVCDMTTSGSTKTVIAPNLVFPAGAASMLVYGGYNPNALTLQYSGAAASSVTLTSLNLMTEGPPDSEVDTMRVRVWKVLHAGIWGADVLSVTSNSITISGAAFTTNEYANRIISVVGIRASEDDIPVWNLRVSSNTADTLTIVTEDPDALGLTTSDVVVMRSIPTMSIVDGNHVWTDAKWVNCFGPSGLTPGALAGKVGRVLYNKGAGQRLRILDNTDTAITFDGKFIVEPDSTSILIVEEPDFVTQIDSSPINNSVRGDEISMQVEVSNYLLQQLLVEVATVDSGGAESIREDNPCREIYIFGEQASDQIGVISYA